MGIRQLSMFTSLLLVASLCVAAPKPATQKAKATAKKVAVKKAKKAQTMDVEAELENELSGQIQDEPTTQVEASPLEESESAKMRAERRRLELQTEERIAQELEASRMNDEKTRRNRVFGAPAQTSNEVVTQAPEVEDEDSSTSYYMGVMGGLVDSRANNVDGAGAVGFSLGMGFPLHSTSAGLGSLAVEAGFLYSLLEGKTDTALGSTDYDVDKYNVTASGRYTLESGWFIPGAGLIMSYTRRQYKVPGDDNFSNAFDGGVTVTGDVRMNKSITVGLEYRYMANLDYEKDKGASRADVAAQKAVTNSEIKNLEAIDYQMFLLNGKISF